MMDAYRRKIISASVICGLVIIALILSIFGSFQESSRQEEAIRHNMAVISSLQELRIALIDDDKEAIRRHTAILQAMTGENPVIRTILRGRGADNTIMAHTIAAAVQSERDAMNNLIDERNASLRVATYAVLSGLTICFILLSAVAAANLRLQRALHEQTIRDPLTKLFNRRYLEETLSRELTRARRSKYSVSALAVDIDHFKAINDNFGHEAGDSVLKAAAAKIIETVRKDDVPCRTGGEEFVIVMPNADAEQAMARAEEIRAALSSLSAGPESGGGEGIRFTVSIGVACAAQGEESADQLLMRADSALYRAKKSGRDRCILAEPVADIPSKAA